MKSLHDHSIEYLTSLLNGYALFFMQDIETFDLEDFKYNFVNMTAFRLVDSDHYRVRQVLKDMESFQPIGHYILNKTRVIQVRTVHVNKQHAMRTLS